MLTYRHKDGRTQNVQEREKVKIAILERLCWRLDSEPLPEPEPELEEPIIAQETPVTEVSSAPKPRGKRSKTK